jgi:hypothetical protein
MIEDHGQQAQGATRPAAGGQRGDARQAEREIEARGGKGWARRSRWSAALRADMAQRDAAPSPG